MKRQKHRRLKRRHYRLYALELAGGYYYVGMTAYWDVRVRFRQHVEGARGAQWTKLHTPRRIIEVRELGWCSEARAAGRENAMTREYMARYGLYQVRGGDLCFVDPRLVLTHFTDARGLFRRMQRHRLRAQAAAALRMKR